MNDHLAPAPLVHRRHSNDAYIDFDRPAMVLIVPRDSNPAMTLVDASTPHGVMPLPTRYHAARVGLGRVEASQHGDVSINPQQTNE